MKRGIAVTTVAVGLLGGPALIVVGRAVVAAEPAARPRMYVTAGTTPGVRSVAELKADVRLGHAGKLWDRLKSLADADLAAPPLVPSSPVPGRDPDHVRHGNRDFELCHAAGQRVLRAALASLLTGEAKYRDSALRQMESLFDPVQWPDWRDLSHLDMAADLRTGALARDLAVAYDWLYPALAPEQRRTIVAGIDRRGIQPFWQAVDDRHGGGPVHRAGGRRLARHPPRRRGGSLVDPAAGCGGTGAVNHQRRSLGSPTTSSAGARCSPRARGCRSPRGLPPVP